MKGSVLDNINEKGQAGTKSMKRSGWDEINKRSCWDIINKKVRLEQFRSIKRVRLGQNQ